METKIKWNQGDGYITASYNGSGDGAVVVTSDVNNGDERQQYILVETEDKSISIPVLVVQKGGGTVETYTRLTYIEATGEQYINTGYVVQDDDVIEMQYVTTLNSSTDKMLFGCYDDKGAIWFEIYSNTAYCRFGSDSSSTSSNARQKNRMKIYRGQVDIDGTKVTLLQDDMPQVPLYLFARNEKDEKAVMYGRFKSIGCSISKVSGEVVMDL